MVQFIKRQEHDEISAADYRVSVDRSKVESLRAQLEELRQERTGLEDRQRAIPGEIAAAWNDQKALGALEIEHAKIPTRLALLDARQEALEIAIAEAEKAAALDEHGQLLGRSKRLTAKQKELASEYDALKARLLQLEKDRSFLSELQSDGSRRMKDLQRQHNLF